MINEAFWFMYLAQLGGTLVMVAVWSLAVLLLTAAWINDYYDLEEHARAFKVGACVVGVLMLVAIAYPSEDAFYAGAGMYVAQETELTDTLLSLKELIDHKIEEARDE